MMTHKLSLSAPIIISLSGAVILHAIFLIGMCMLTPEEYYRLGSGHPVMMRKGFPLVRKHVRTRSRHTAHGARTKAVEVVYELPEELQGVFDTLGLGVMKPNKPLVKKPPVRKNKTKKTKAALKPKKAEKKVAKKPEPVKAAQKQTPVVVVKPVMPVQPEQPAVAEQPMVEQPLVETKVVVLGRDAVPAVVMPRGSAKSEKVKQAISQSIVAHVGSADATISEETGDDRTSQESSSAVQSAASDGAGVAGKYEGYGEGDGQYAAFGDLVDITGSGSGEILSDEQYDAVLELHEVLQQHWSPPVRCSDEPIEVEVTVRHDGTLSIDSFTESTIPAVNFAVKRLLLTTIPEQLLHKVGGLKLKLHLKA